MELAGTTTVDQCTAYDVREGIIGNGSGISIQNTIAADVQVSPGISGYDVDYCISNKSIIGSTTSQAFSDPLFCAEDSTTWSIEDRLALRVDSWGNPYNNPGGKQIGVFPVQCMFGELQDHTAWEGGEIGVWGDTKVKAGKYLTLGEGAVLTFAAVDNQATGVDTSLVELLVEGKLIADGTAQNPVVFQGETGTRGEWYGVICLNDGYPSGGKHFVHTEIRDATFAIRDSISEPLDHLLLDNVLIENFETAGVYLSLTPGTTGASQCSLMTTTIDMKGAPYGVFLESDGAYQVVIEDLNIVGDATGNHGLHLDVKGAVNPPTDTTAVDAQITNVTVDSLTAGTGVLVENFSPVLADIDVTQCKYGIQLLGSESPVVEADALGAESDLVNCTTGMYTYGTVTPDVDDVNITVPSMKTGLYTDGSSGGSYTGLAISGGGTGFKAWSSTSHTLRASSVTGFTTYGVWVASGGLPLCQHE